MTAKLTLETFKDAARGRGGECLSSSYGGAAKPLDFVCAKGHAWITTGMLIRKGHWCPKCSDQAQLLGLEVFRELAASKGGTCLSEEYAGANARLAWRCALGHRWMASGNNVRNNGSWCPRCASASRKKAEGDVVRRAPAPSSKIPAKDLGAWIREHARSHGGQCLTPDIAGRKTRVEFENADGRRWESFAGRVCRDKVWRE